MWYPAAEGTSALAPYMDKKTADALAEEWKLQSDFQRLVRAHARLLAPIAEGGPFPVVLLERGSSVVPAIYTILAEGLASSGFIVVATNHPPDSLISVFPDGHELKFTPYWPAEADRRTQGVAIGKFADEVLVADVRFVLDQLQEMNLHDHFWHGHLDLSKIGIHSRGSSGFGQQRNRSREIPRTERCLRKPIGHVAVSGFGIRMRANGTLFGAAGATHGRILRWNGSNGGHQGYTPAAGRP
jgi:hypothetical protein